MKKVFILHFSFILNSKVRDVDSLSYGHWKSVVFKREGDLELISDKFVIVKLKIIFTKKTPYFAKCGDSPTE